MPFIKIYIHVVFSTKNRIPYFNTSELKIKVWKHIKENATEKGIFLDIVNGYSDHCHCLISLSSNQNIEKVVQLLKGESSHWINKNQLTKEKFAWQDEYFAVSVSESMVESVRQYIKNQETHHSKKPFTEEYQEFIEKYNFK
ncbi:MULTISPECIES: IS200/IS605 family transposase [Chryseobacterium]|uniref:REP element-mobilizing transposase RayT n=1 Tax=Chryseobacterium geocarposphaerae TaxID=1416776 RepID=A0A2M9CA48_9FLAO|nr:MULTISPECIES: IS200/IS605 family transposase [Chryseobacterium]MPS65533.1 IS200/IS605 family transposase [Chryseobacterium sp.]PJJ67697.1 REP element-mobilizing transposase RayT [Chryseobacterium geocarposphaerae]PZU26522.1 MAG: IS200/IS605 family transposase [Chryseobacterium sp.]